MLTEIPKRLELCMTTHYFKEGEFVNGQDLTCRPVYQIDFKSTYRYGEAGEDIIIIPSALLPTLMVRRLLQQSSKTFKTCIRRTFFRNETLGNMPVMLAAGNLSSGFVPPLQNQSCAADWLFCCLFQVYFGTELNDARSAHIKVQVPRDTIF